MSSPPFVAVVVVVIHVSHTFRRFSTQQLLSSLLLCLFALLDRLAPGSLEVLSLAPLLSHLAHVVRHVYLRKDLLLPRDCRANDAELRRGPQVCDFLHLYWAPVDVLLELLLLDLFLL